MKIVALEEHMVIPQVLEAWSAAGGAWADPGTQPEEGVIARRLAELGEQRVRDMDATGVDVQVLSLTTPGVQNLAGDDAVRLATVANDAIAAVIASRPDRFDGFATLPTPEPDAAVDELRRAVGTLGFKGAMLNGRTGGRNVDHPDFAEIYAAAAELHAPIYIHPNLPQPPVRDAYYSGFGDAFDAMFASWGLGWHVETGIQLLRLIFSGAFDRHPELQVVVGHWGEVVLFYLERIEGADRMGLGLDRPLADYLRQNVSYTPSGIHSQRYLRWTIDVVGVDRVMYAADYPFVDVGEEGARTFIEQAPLSFEDKKKIAHGNWERLTRSAPVGRPERFAREASRPSAVTRPSA
ncbi:MAG TPA: amidohydrolase family protein [Baekduia sp.]